MSAISQLIIDFVITVYQEVGMSVERISELLDLPQQVKKGDFVPNLNDEQGPRMEGFFRSGLSPFASSSHHAAEIVIDPSLISFSGAPEPGQHVGIDPDCHAGLLWPIEFADYRGRWYLADFRDVRKVDIAVRSRSESLQLFLVFSS
jgi:hypothetical protein